MAQAIEHLLSKCKALSSNPNPIKTKQNKSKTKTKQNKNSSMGWGVTSGLSYTARPCLKTNK
jgi:hypothetical protein